MINAIKYLQKPALFVLAMSFSLPAVAATPHAEEVKPKAVIAEPKEEKSLPAAPNAAPAVDDLEIDGEVSPLSEKMIEDHEEKNLTAADVDFDTIESFGLAGDSKGQALGKQFYSNSKRSVMTALVQEMPHSNWVVLQDLSNQVLLAPANTAVLNNDVPFNFEKGRDLLTLRVEKLLERGFNKEAYALYTRLKIDPYNEKIARLGIISMLLNAQKPLACVEMKTFDAPFKNDVFWKEMDAYCILSLSSEAFPQKKAVVDDSKHAMLKKIIEDKSFRFRYTPKTFKALSLFEKSLLVSENMLDISGLTDAAYKSIPAEDVQSLLALQNLDNKAKILLNARGVETGVISPSEFAKVYIRIGRKAEKEKKALTGLEHISTLYWKRLDTFLPENRQATINEVMEYSRQYGYILVVPFLEDFSKLGPNDSLSLQDLYIIVRAFFMAGTEMPAQWLDFIRTRPVTGPDQEKNKEILMISAALMSGDKDNNPDKLQAIYDILEKPQNSSLANLKNIIENIDNRTGNYAKVHFAYEKGFDLGVNKGYTIPPAALLEQLKLSSQSHATGETVLLCNLILQGIEQRSIYPGILADVARALSEVGLGKQSQRLLAEAVLSIGK